MSKQKNYLSIVNHYEDCFQKYGDTHLGVDWPKKEDVDKRYQVMLDIIKFPDKGTRIPDVLDFGCGAAHLNEFILQHKINIKYSGLDISEKFIEHCRKKYPENNFYCTDILEDKPALPAFDYILMNGVFTEKRNLSFNEMFDYFQTMLKTVFLKSTKGVAFNVMSKHVEWERDDLFHLPFDILASFLTKELGRNFIIRNDYGLYEYTVYVYKISL